MPLKVFMRFSQLIILFTLSLHTLQAQILDENDQALEIEAQESSLQDVEDYHHDLRQRKIRINFLSVSEFADIPFLTPLQQNAILKHIQNYGPLNNIYELQTIEELSLSQILVLKPILDFSLPFAKSVSKAIITPEHRQQILIQNSFRHERARGYQLPDNDSRAYLGGREKTLLRYTFQSNDKFKSGFHFEKDAGEQYKHGSVSAFAHLKLKNKLNELILGDFVCQFGQGLNISNGLSLSKSSNIQNTVRISTGFRPYRSGSEYGYWRGIGAKIQLGNHALYLAYSLSPADFRVQTDSLNVRGVLIENGYYRSQKELDIRNKGWQMQSLIRHQFKTNKWKIGQSLYLNSQFLKSGLDNGFPGKQTVSRLNWSMDYLGKSGNALFYGESTIDNSGQIKSLNGCLIALGKALDLNFMYTCQLHQNHTAQKTGGIHLNEQTFYTGLSCMIHKHWKVVVYNEFMESYVFAYNRDGHGNNRTTLAELKYEKRYGPMLYVRLKYGHNYINETGTQIINRLELNAHQSLRLHLEYPLGINIKCYHRIEKSLHQKQFGSVTNGILSFHEIQFDKKMKWKFNIRVTNFNIDDFNTRIYTYQHDISHSFTVKAFQNRGSEIYGLFQYRVNKKLNLKFRFAVIQYENTSVIGSGLDEINRPQAHDVRIEVQMKL